MALTSLEYKVRNGYDGTHCFKIWLLIDDKTVIMMSATANSTEIESGRLDTDSPMFIVFRCTLI